MRRKCKVCGVVETWSRWRFDAVYVCEDVDGGWEIEQRTRACGGTSSRVLRSWGDRKEEAAEVEAEAAADAEA